MALALPQPVSLFDREPGDGTARSGFEATEWSLKQELASRVRALNSLLMPGSTDPAPASSEAAATLTTLAETSQRTTRVASAFRSLFGARGESRDALFEWLAKTAAPEEVLQVALADYSEKGNADRLDLAARLLSEMGRDAWPTLDSLSTSGIAGQEVFVPMALDLPTEVRQRLLMNFARSANHETRWQVVRSLDRLDAATVKTLAAVLRKDADEDLAAAVATLAD